MSIYGALTSFNYLDWFNANGESSFLARIGPNILVCLNIPPNEILNWENFYFAGIIPRPKEPTSLQLNDLLMPLIEELKEMWQGYVFSPTSTGPSGSFISVAILMAIADVASLCIITAFISHSA
ncbi:hypothetical protein O181_014524 [Austropuccinia psidii MF-1]|uniref:Uncharacterized protein n=1 Tax=Austropuccinia psidii MF-1 TaxID=1389203 RepID=A0A9Q3BY98_9BASI|nr:hypothetical protein [Austropuccinia psidii MF-1]